MKSIKILFIIIVSSLILGCNNSDDNKQENIKKLERIKPINPIINQIEKRVFGIHKKNNRYELDTTVILSNKNLMPLINELKKEKLISKETYQEAPKIVRSLLDSLTGKFDIANPGENWQIGCVSIIETIERKVNDSTVEVTFDYSNPLPTRQLIYLGMSDSLIVLSYYKGGFAKNGHTLIIKYDDQEVIDLWKGCFLFDVKNKNDIIEYFRQNQNEEWELYVNNLHF